MKMPNTDAQSGRHVDRQSAALLRLVHVGILISLLWKGMFYVGCAFIYRDVPIYDPFFPYFFQSSLVAEIAFVGSLVASIAILFASTRRFMILCSTTTLAATIVLSIHQLSYNDVTFMCCAWTSLWSVWFSTRIDKPFELVFDQAVWLSHLMLSTIFIGAAIGKLTPGYWSGQILYEVYFVDRDFWTYNLLRSFYDQETLRVVAKWHSQTVIISELICGFLWVMPARMASAVAVIMLCGIALTNNTLLFSVVSCLLTLSLVGLHQPRSQRSKKSSTGAAIRELAIRPKARFLSSHRPN